MKKNKGDMDFNFNGHVNCVTADLVMSFCIHSEASCTFVLIYFASLIFFKKCKNTKWQNSMNIEKRRKILWRTWSITQFRKEKWHLELHERHIYLQCKLLIIHYLDTSVPRSLLAHQGDSCTSIYVAGDG